jgi:hypothetical protein
MEKGSMEDIRRIIVNEHIADLRRDADALRLTRRLPYHTRDRDPACAEAPDGRPARVRLGHWLIGVGTAIAGSASGGKGGTARSAF